MTMPVPLNIALEEAWIEREARRRRAMTDGVITHEEAMDIFAFDDREIHPRLTTLTTTVSVIRSLTAAGDGYQGSKVKRMLLSLWKRKD